MSGKKKEKEGSGFFWKLLLLMSVGVFAFSGYQLFSIFSEYKQGVDEYDSMSHQVVTKSEDPLEIIEQKTTEDGQILTAELPDYQAPDVDFDQLQAMNPDVIGWIEIEAIPEISYPIVQTSNNDYYLHRTVNRTSNSAGAIFVDYTNSSDFTDCNTIIYGHNMKNGSMFGKLKQLCEKEKYKYSKYIWICTPQGKYRYEIFSMQYANVNSDTYTFFREHDEQFGNYLVNMAAQSQIDMQTQYLTKEDYVITLSTCTSNENTRFVVQARWIATY